MILDKIERWLAIAETCSDKRMAIIVAEMRDAIAEIEDDHENGWNNTPETHQEITLFNADGMLR